jgi:hypothetical protein
VLPSAACWAEVASNISAALHGRRSALPLGRISTLRRCLKVPAIEIARRRWRCGIHDKGMIAPSSHKPVTEPLTDVTATSQRMEKSIQRRGGLSRVSHVLPQAALAIPEGGMARGSL